MRQTSPRHPNRRHFRGVLAPLETASDRAPAGARGNRVVLTHEAAQRALPSLIGMALDYTPALDGHDARRKVGVITAAGIKDGQLVVAGHLFAQDFPELMREFARPRSALGLSYEVTDARIEDVRAPIWRLSHVTFTGAAVLRRNKAAYRTTSIELIPENDLKGATMSEAIALPQSRDLAPAPTAGPAPEPFYDLAATTAQLAAAAEALSSAVRRMDEAHAELAGQITLKLDRITAAIESEGECALAARLAELEKNNADLTSKLQAAGTLRKSLSPVVGAILAKNGVEVADGMDLAALDSALKPLSVEQRVAVKSQMAKAGLIS